MTCHPERSGAKSKDPVYCHGDAARTNMGSLDFARDDGIGK